MSQETEQQILETLREIREGQREVVRLLSAQQVMAEEQVKRSRDAIAESVSLQRLALQRQRNISFIAAPAILVCMAAIAYLILRYF